MYIPGKHSTSPQVMFRIKLSKCWLRCPDTICNCVISTRPHFVACSLEILFCNEGTVDWKLPKLGVNKQASFSSVFFLFVSRRKEKEISFFLWKERSPGEEMKITGDAFSLSKQLLKDVISWAWWSLICIDFHANQGYTVSPSLRKQNNSQEQIHNRKQNSFLFFQSLSLSFIYSFIDWLVD